MHLEDTVVVTNSDTAHRHGCPRITRGEVVPDPLDLESPCPPWRIKSLEEVNLHRRYKPCKVCCPDMLARPKWTGPTVKAGNISGVHIGRAIDGVTVEWVRLDAKSTTLGMCDGTVRAFCADDRIAFDPKGGVMS